MLVDLWKSSINPAFILRSLNTQGKLAMANNFRGKISVFDIPLHYQSSAGADGRERGKGPCPSLPPNHG